MSSRSVNLALVSGATVPCRGVPYLERKHVSIAPIDSNRNCVGGAGLLPRTGALFDAADVFVSAAEPLFDSAELPALSFAGGKPLSKPCGPGPRARDDFGVFNLDSVVRGASVVGVESLPAEALPGAESFA